MSEIDSTLSGIIIILLLVVVWKWNESRASCGKSGSRLSCGCNPGRCMCQGRSQGFVRPGNCPGGRGCSCGCSLGRCGCPPNCSCNSEGETEGFTPKDAVNRVTGSGPMPDTAATETNDYSAAIKDMSLEAGVGDSHNRYCDSLSFSGMPTGSSACTELEETGRSYGTANFVGLTQRKWCKARNLAMPAEDARVTPSYNINEYCSLEMDALI